MPAASVSWSSLPPDLVSCVGEILLSAGDIDSYMTFRAACRSWRAATDDPCGLSRRFRPHRWVMLDDLSRHVDSRLFLNLDTGRFLRKNVPLLNDGAYTYVGAADGLILLKVDTGYGCDICILNPFTGSTLRFPSGLASRRQCSRVAVTADATAPLVFLFLDCLGGVCYDPSNPLPRWFSAERSPVNMLINVLSFQGRAYIADAGGSVKVVGCPKGPHTNLEITTIIKHNSVTERSFLVDNVGELLLVGKLPSMPGHPRYSPFVRRMHVFRLDLERKALEPIKSIGNRAIFLGPGHCLSIDTNHLPAIEANCIYYYNVKEKDIQMYLYHLEDGSRELLTSPPLHGPSSLAQIILEYCRGRS
ncbi:hypothetical protein CFC21_079096 [Triticum aestivum]|uniref:KIB1-4 beta-propeller domain-containing protein n=3 Tax=Triticinae TaxID=1648030 RepID=A0A3B6MV74_WHEAT|nr:hypothetical protein CFC21_079096 [Triticum aestivum]